MPATASSRSSATSPSRGSGSADEQVAQLSGHVEHFFHLAAMYDMTADDASNERLNVGGTRNAVELANAIEAGHLHHVSSVAVAGERRGLFREDHFDEGQKLPSAYHRTKFESEKLVREQAKVPWRVYRPAIVVGHSQTGEMDKIDGPYYFFKAIQKVRGALPQWVPLVGPELGYTNIVPVDYVAAAMDHIAHQPDLDGQAFHLTNPVPMRVGESLNEFAKAAHAPQLALRIDKRLTDALPKGTLSMLMKLPQVRDVRNTMLADFGIPEEVIEHMALKPQFDTRDTERALAGTGHRGPRAAHVRREAVGLLGAHARPRPLQGPLVREAHQRAHGRHHRRVERHRPGDGAEGRGRRRHPAARRARDREARGAARGDRGVGRHGARLQRRPVGHGRDRRPRRAHARRPPRDRLPRQQRRAARSAARSSCPRTASTTSSARCSSNYFGAIKMIMALLPHMRERGFGHIVNVSSIGVQTNPPRFSAYVASKGALDAWTRVVSSEVIGNGISFTTIHMPLVRTPMIAPTKLYDHFPTISPDEAADLICEAMRARPKEINTRLGTAGEVLHALAPKAVDQILHIAYKVFPDSAASKGEKDPASAEKANMEQIAMANIMKGVHW